MLSSFAEVFDNIGLPAGCKYMVNTRLCLSTETIHGKRSNLESGHFHLIQMMCPCPVSLVSTARDPLPLSLLAKLSSPCLALLADLPSTCNKHLKVITFNNLMLPGNSGEIVKLIQLQR